MSKPVILTGLRANNDLTIGNYFGGIRPMIDMATQHAGDYQLNMFIPDLHSFTTPIDHSTLYQQTLRNARVFAAAGLPLDNPDIFLYRQSFVPAHSELTWILDCFTYVGEMQRMTQFKDKSSEQDASVTMGLMNYPVLMAADILLYGAEYVPVGEDQFQHLEITRDIATRFNNKFGETFVVPRETAVQTSFIQRDKGLRIRSLTDPAKKMSKSSTDEKSKILLCDTPAAARKKIMGATTDSIGRVNFDWDAQPGVTSLLQIMALLRGVSQDEVNAEWVGCERYGDFKKAVADEVEAFLTGFHERLEALTDEVLLAKLEASEQAMSVQAAETLARVQQAVGLRPKDGR